MFSCDKYITKFLYPSCRVFKIGNKKFTFITHITRFCMTFQKLFTVLKISEQIWNKQYNFSKAIF